MLIPFFTSLAEKERFFGVFQQGSLPIHTAYLNWKHCTTFCVAACLFVVCSSCCLLISHLVTYLWRSLGDSVWNKSLHCLRTKKRHTPWDFGNFEGKTAESWSQRFPRVHWVHSARGATFFVFPVALLSFYYAFYNVIVKAVTYRRAKAVFTVRYSCREVAYWGLTSRPFRLYPLGQTRHCRLCMVWS